MNANTLLHEPASSDSAFYFYLRRHFFHNDGSPNRSVVPGILTIPYAANVEVVQHAAHQILGLHTTTVDLNDGSQVLVLGWDESEVVNEMHRIIEEQDDLRRRRERIIARNLRVAALTRARRREVMRRQEAMRPRPSNFFNGDSSHPARVAAILDGPVSTRDRDVVDRETHVEPRPPHLSRHNYIVRRRPFPRHG